MQFAGSEAERADGHDSSESELQQHNISLKAVFMVTA